MRTMIVALVLLLTALPASAQPPRGKDLFGDPLPEGAVLRLGTTRLRAPINSFGILPDGTVVTVGPGNEVRTWGLKDDASDAPIPLPLAGPLGNEYPQVSPDGRFVAASTGVKVVVWERPVDRIKEIASFERNRPRYLLFSPDGSKLAVSHANDRVERVSLCDIKTGTVNELLGEGNFCEALAFSGDGTRLAVAFPDRVFVWNVADGKQLADYKTTRVRIRQLALDTTGERMAVVPGWEPHEVQFIETLTGKRIENLTGPPCRGWVSFAADGKTVFAGDRKGVRWWDPAAGKLIRDFEGVADTGQNGLPPPGRLTPDGKTLVVQNGSMLLRWDAATGKPLFPAQHDAGHASYVNGLGIAPDGKRIATRGMDSQVIVWDAATGKRLWKAPALWSGDPQVVFSADGKAVFTAGPERGELTKRDAGTGRALQLLTVDKKEPTQSDPYPIRLSPDGKTLFAVTGPRAAGDPSLLTAWDAETGERKVTTRLRLLLHFGYELSPDGRFVAGDGQAFLVGDDKQDLLAEVKLQTLFQPGQFSADGRWLTLTGYNLDDKGRTQQLAVVVDTATWKRVATIPIPKNSRVALSPDAKTLAVAGGDALAFVDAPSGTEFARYRLPDEDWATVRMFFTMAVRFSPDGTRLVTGHQDSTALVWAVPPRPKK